MPGIDLALGTTSCAIGGHHVLHPTGQPRPLPSVAEDDRSAAIILGAHGVGLVARAQAIKRRRLLPLHPVDATLRVLASPLGVAAET